MAPWNPVSAALCVLTMILIGNFVESQVLTPPYFNLAQQRRAEATATCGVGVVEPELFCKLTGANPDGVLYLQPNFSVIQGQLCDYCSPGGAELAHPAEQAIDGTEAWWQSPPLSRGLKYNQVNFTIDLGQEFHVAYVLIKMANSPRPGVFALERSIDGGQTWMPWQYFADTYSDCNTYFGSGTWEKYITKDDSVICTTEYSKVVPLEGGEIVVSLVNNRPNALNFSYGYALQEWTRATNVRLRLLRTKTLLGHLMAVARQDPTVVRRYFYSIKDISIGGRCVCNGHAEICDKTDPTDHLRLLCRCQHNTCGPQCETCCPGFVQKPWEPATQDGINACEPCQCYGHTTECLYDAQVAAEGRSVDIYGNYEGGGVCQNCRDNTEGINCEKCVFGYYRPSGVPLDSPNVCRPCRCDPTYSTGDCSDGDGRCYCQPRYTGPNCDRCNAGYYGYPRCDPCVCNVNGTRGQVCEVGGGQCPCKSNYDGRNCDRCAFGFYGFPECHSCACDGTGSLGAFCDAESGQCSCRSNFAGRDCAQCEVGYYGYPACQVCNCDVSGSTELVCDRVTGQCLCQPGFGGPRCDRCDIGFYRYPFCVECGCSPTGSQVNDCDATGQCICQSNFGGKTCDRCAPGHYRYPECSSCNCDTYGAYGVTCDQSTGQCNCRPTFQGLSCDRCRENFYNYPNCEECNCNPAGAKEVFGYPLGGCGSSSLNIGQLCDCKERVGGHICDTCKPGYWNLNRNNPQGCEDCGCFRPGTTGGSGNCNPKNGQCVCKTYTNSRRCDTCQDGTYNLQEHNIFGCQGCDCEIGGSLGHGCDKVSGQCTCRPRVQGRRCDRPLPQHYFPTLFQHQYELEDGRTPSGGLVRYGFDENIFRGYSWRGYAIFSRIQEEILVDVDIQKPSLHHIIFYYMNRSPGTVTAEVKVTPETSTDVEQSSTVVFQPSYSPAFVTVSGTPFVLNPGRWTISLKTPENIFVDYLVLLPQAYYEATILQERVTRPCTVPADSNLCKHFMYADVSAYDVARGESGYVRVDNRRERTQLFPDRNIREQLGSPDMAYLDRRQTNVYLNLPVSRPGKYVLVLQYYSSQTEGSQELSIDVATAGTAQRGRLSLPGCPYSSLCRQMVVDQDGSAQVLDIQGGYASVTLQGQSNIDLAVDSIIAVPYDEWQLEFIQPRFKCVRRDGQCIDSTYISTPGSVRAEFEQGPNVHRIETELPPNIIDTSVKVIRLDGSAPNVNVKASVIEPAPHVFVVHYYQPYHAGFDVDVNVTVDNVVNKGTLHADYCPGVSGCRSTVHFHNTVEETVLDLSNLDILVSFNNPSGHPIWLDYIMVVPSIQYDETVLDVMPVDRAGKFIQLCGQENFYMKPETEGFCRDSVFSLTTEFNNGALGCECNIDGSRAFNCDAFGGQCQCKSNVIGRTCSQCRTGFYGFPNCRPCSCPSGLCDPVSGQCVCPPRVTGPNCNVCLPRTFGFDPLIGCEECNCAPQGVVSNKLDCDINTGQCSCKPNVAGRSCGQCVAGYYAFPSCLQCSCDRRGTTPNICDQRSAVCSCKGNVDGPQCAQCKPSTYYLEDRNPKGCTQCFCFGTTDRCDSSSYRRSQVRVIRGWGITNLRRPNVRRSAGTLTVKVKDEDVVDSNEAIYWIAPEPYLGNKVTSYGGKLIYTVTFTLASGVDSSGLVRPDVRFEGNNQTLIHISPEQPVPGKPLTVEVDMLETMFVHELSGAPVSREQFMMALSAVDALQIRASYYTVVNKVVIGDIQLDIAAPDGSGSLARNVEQCQCPANYQGTSCEKCAPGYYRSKAGLYLGVCVACQCNGKAESCDPDTGDCINCRDNFGGPQCLSCKQGYYQDSFTGRCEICSCPMPFESNNFASTCEVYNNVVHSCECLPGYAGPRCDSCDLGYFGNPNELGGSCLPCDCSGNINIYDPRSCDPINGECLLCINNSTGPHCDRCKEWFWGDAIDLKSCTECVCNRIGAERCDPYSGTCLCKPNVVGPTCDRCAPGTFGFESGRGCERCDCALASYGPECDRTTGECDCRPGVTGRRCDQCEQNYWNYGPLGCDECQCESEGATTCDPATGYCQCLPGVTGRLCDQCMDRWVMVPDRGCRECDSCVHLLVDEMDILEHNVTTILRELDDVSVGVGSFRRLDRINKTVITLRPLVDGLIRDPSDDSILDDLKDDLRELEWEADSIQSRGERTVKESEAVEIDARETLEEARKLADLVRMGVDVAREAVRYAQEVLQDILNNIQGQNVDFLIRDAERILEEIRRRDFRQQERNAITELEKARLLLERVRDMHNQAFEQANRTDSLRIHLEDVENKLRDLINSSRHSLDNSQAAIDLNIRNRRIIENIRITIQEIEELNANIRMMIDMAKDMLDEARTFLSDARRAYLVVERELSRLDVAVDNLNNFVDDLENENRQLRPLVDNATEHALNLKRQADELENLFADTRHLAEAALNASRAYKNIVDAINDALNASRQAVDAAMEALEKSSGLAERARKSRERSERLKEEADKTKSKVTDELRPRLISAVEKVDIVRRLNDRTEDGLTDILLGLGMLPEGGFGDRANEAAMRAMRAQSKADEANTKISVIVEKLPTDLEKARQIPVDIDMANAGIRRAQTQVDQVIQLVPEATNLLDTLVITAERVTQVGVDLTNKIRMLRDSISVSRAEAGRIGVGLQYFRNTTLQLRNPPNLLQAGSYAKISLFFRTREPNGFLAYVGPDKTTGGLQTQDDYMALEIIDGQVVFKYDLGAGPGLITNTKNVADGLWHEVIAERTGKSGTLTLRTAEEEDVVIVGESPGTFSVLDLNPLSTKFFVGGVPETAGLEQKLVNLRYVGCLENVRFDGLPVGLWDFVIGENNYKGCPARDTLTQPPPNGFRFNGEGYVVLNRDRFRPSKASMVSLKFKTYADKGLLFFVGEDRDFMSLEIDDGKVVFQYDLGSGRARLESTERYNDGQWHHVVANRLKQDGLLKVDSATVASGRSPGDLKELAITDDIFIGGYRGTFNYVGVVNQGFEGCIKDVMLGSTVRDINDNKYAKGILPGCPSISRIVSFDREVSNAYIAMDPVNVNSDFQMTLKIKSEEKDGLVFYTSDDTQANSFAISIVNGKIVLTGNPGGSPVQLETNIDAYSDGRWHYITVTKEGRDLQLDIDDSEMVKTKIEGRRRIITTSPLYFGGVPPGFSVVSENVGTEVRFIGCIGDVTVKGNFINFAQAPPTNRVGAYLSSCSIPDPTPTISPLPTFMPIFTVTPTEASGRGGASLAGCPIADPTPSRVTPTYRPPVRPDTPPPGVSLGPPVAAQCALPRVPVDVGSDGQASGTRFGAAPDSRQEYDIIQGIFRVRSNFTVEFKTTSTDGVIFYVADNRQVDFISLYMKGGQVVYSFNCGTGDATITSPQTYNDDEWHKVSFHRDQRRGWLVIDDVQVAAERSRGNSKSINVNAPFYVGGLSADAANAAITNLDQNTGGFVGCLRNFELDGTSFGEPTRQISVEPCSGQMETGSFFYEDGGYLQLSESFKVNLDLDITLEIRPRSLSGVILSVASVRGDYLVLQMVDGQIVFNVDNGRGEIQAIYPPPFRNDLCNGEWHTIKAVKAKNVVALSVDDVFLTPGIGESGVSSTDTNDPLYMGGVPEAHRGIKTTEQYVGCIRNLQMDKVPQDVSSAVVTGRVNIGSCPTT